MDPSRIRHIGSLATRPYRIIWLVLATITLNACGGGGGSSSPPEIAKFTVAGTVTGLLNASSMTILNNGADSLTVSSSSQFTFPTPIAAGSAYAVTIASQPIGHQCTVAGASGSVQANVSSVRIDCVAQSYSIGGTVEGLQPGKSVTLKNNAADALTITSNAAFAFATKLTFGSHYDVTVSSEPPNQTCTVSSGSATVSAADVTNIKIVCAEKTYTIGGKVTGLEQGGSVTLINNGGESINVSSNGAFVFATSLRDGSSYRVSASWQQPEQNCLVSAGSGSIAANNVTNIVVQCVHLRTLYSFGTQGTDGSGPYSGLVMGGDGNLYGTTGGGGANVVDTLNGLGPGTFFKVTPSGEQTVLWFFGLGLDGRNPTGTMAVDAQGNFYGSTYQGGSHAEGTVFKMTPTGQETVLWNFGAGSDGQKPFGSLVLGQDGNLYGTTSEGGAHGFGIVFRVTPQGGETVLWNFGAGLDGRRPVGRIVQTADGTLYGTTESGGQFGFGTVFKLTPSGVEQVLYSFAAGEDGQGPEGLTLTPQGELYGVTVGGGGSNFSAGIVFKVTPNGIQKLWTFGGEEGDGHNPLSTVLYGADGNFYGTTANGGEKGAGCVYRLTPDGVMTVLWSFKTTYGSGFGPNSTLTQGPDGTLYGTTYRGGTGSYGYGGTVFKLTL